MQLVKQVDLQQQLNPAPDDRAPSDSPGDSFEIPYDPNLVCPRCGRQFRRGEIQKLRRHYNSACCNDGESLEENPLLKGLDADMESAALEIKRMCSFNSNGEERHGSRQSSGEELTLNLTKQLNSISSELTKRTGNQALVVCGTNYAL